MDRRGFLQGASAGATSLTLAGTAQAASGDVTGGVAPGFEAVRDAFVAAQKGDPGGAQLCVYQRGRRVADLWAGQDTANNRPFGPDNVTMVMSATKGMTAIAAHDLIQQGRIDLAAPVARYWPEFAANGKAEVTVAQILSHKSGLAQFPPDSGIVGMELLDWNRCVAALAAAKPEWPPGQAVRYHSVTFGYLVGEVIRRVSGRSVGRYIAETYSGPLKLDLWIGNTPARVDALYAPQFSTIATYSAATNALLNAKPARMGEIPAANGICNARSLAKLYAATLGEIDGRPRILRRETIARAAVDQSVGFKEPDGTPLLSAYSLGFNAPSRINPMMGPGCFGHSGAGGRLGIAHPQSGIAFAYVCTNMAWEYGAGPDARWGFLAPLCKIAKA